MYIENLYPGSHVYKKKSEAINILFINDDVLIVNASYQK